MGLAELLDVAGNVHRCQAGKTFQASIRIPRHKLLHGLKGGAAGVRVAHVDGEELREAPAALGHGLEKRGQDWRSRSHQSRRALYIHPSPTVVSLVSSSEIGMRLRPTMKPRLGA